MVSREPVLASATGFALVGILLFVIFDKPMPKTEAPEAMPAGQVTAVDKAEQPVVTGATQELGVYLFNRELIALELAGLILTVAMVGAIVIARRRRVARRGTAPTEKEMLVAPATPIDDNPHSIPVLGTENPRQKAYPET